MVSSDEHVFLWILDFKLHDKKIVHTIALRLPHTGPGMRVAGLQGGVIWVFFVGVMGKLPVVKSLTCCSLDN